MGQAPSTASQPSNSTVTTDLAPGSPGSPFESLPGSLPVSTQPSISRPSTNDSPPQASFIVSNIPGSANTPGSSHSHSLETSPSLEPASTLSSLGKTSSQPPPTSNSISQSSSSGPGSQAPALQPTSISTPISVPPTSTPTKISTQNAKNALPAGVIVGIVAAILLIISVVVLSFWLRRRRQRKQFAAAASARTPATHVPETSEALRISASTIRRQYLANELRATQEKIAEVGELERRTLSTDAPQDSSGERAGVLSSLSTSTTTSQDLVSRLRERDGMLTARIRELEEYIRSPWATGLSDEPPPGYRA